MRGVHSHESPPTSEVVAGAGVRPRAGGSVRVAAGLPDKGGGVPRTVAKAVRERPAEVSRHLLPLHTPATESRLFVVMVANMATPTK